MVLGKKRKCGLGLLSSLLAVICMQPNEAEASFSLKKNSRGEAVIHLQEQLGDLGYLHSAPTGYYGSATEAAVANFQKDMGLEAVGAVGPRTSEQLENVEQMARVVHGEARGEAYEGQVAVAAVILNRLNAEGFPKTIYDVIFQSNAFSCVDDGQYDLKPNESAYRAVMDAIRGWDPSGGALYYYNPEIATNEWILTRTEIKRIGNHVFSF